MLHKAYKLILKQIGQKKTFWASGPTPGGPPGTPLGTRDIQNCQILRRIVTLHATLGLQTKFEANRAKNDILGLTSALTPPPLGPPPGPTLGTMDIQNH